MKTAIVLVIIFVLFVSTSKAPEKLKLVTVHEMYLNSFHEKHRELANSIYIIAAKYNLNQYIMKEIAKIESGYSQKARGAAGEIGTFQIMPSTGKKYSYSQKQLKELYYNIDCAGKILNYLNLKYKGNPFDVIVGYNAGEGNIKRPQNLKPITVVYISRIMKVYNKYKTFDFVGDL